MRCALCDQTVRLMAFDCTQHSVLQCMMYKRGEKAAAVNGARSSVLLLLLLLRVQGGLGIREQMVQPTCLHMMSLRP